MKLIIWKPFVTLVSDKSGSYVVRAPLVHPFSLNYVPQVASKSLQVLASGCYRKKAPRASKTTPKDCIGAWLELPVEAGEGPAELGLTSEKEVGVGPDTTGSLALNDSVSGLVDMMAVLSTVGSGFSSVTVSTVPLVMVIVIGAAVTVLVIVWFPVTVATVSPVCVTPGQPEAVE